MNEVKSQLKDEINSLKIEVQQVKAALEELRSQPQVKPKPTKLTENTPPNETAITPETTIQDVGLPQASRPLSRSEMKSKVNSIARTLKNQGLEVNQTIIKDKILEMYPNSEDWISEDARKEVIRALEKQLFN